MNEKSKGLIDKKEVLKRVERELAKIEAGQVKNEGFSKKPMSNVSVGHPLVMHEKPSLLWRIAHSINRRINSERLEKIFKVLAEFVVKFLPRTKRYYVLNDFLQYYDEQFLRNAYKLILHRDPDIHGAKEYIVALRSGAASRMRILELLRYSKEGKMKKVKVKGLLIRHLFGMVCRIPVLGYIFEIVFAIITFPRIIRRSERYESFVGAKFTKYSYDFDKLSSNFDKAFTDIEGVREGLEDVEALKDELSQKAGAEDVEALKDELSQKAGAEDVEALKGKMATKEEFESKIGKMDERIREYKLSLLDNENKLSSLFEKLREQLPENVSDQRIKDIVKEEEHMLDAFYLALENRFRGSRDQIKSRAEEYLPIVKGSEAGTIDAPVLDIGSGRGEWLELLKENNLRGRGIDLNRIMVEECKDRGFDVKEAEAIEYLSSLEDGSLGAITGMHIVEHLQFDQVIKLFDESYRVLRKGGVLILETPNPENVMIGACNFYVDPTHERPIPPILIQFVAEERGFEKASIMRLTKHRIGDAPEGTDPLLKQILYVAPDYALIAYKN